MRFTIISTKPGHQPPMGSCDFYSPGGTIGRGTDNNLVLPDNDRGISRLQAIVQVTPDGECFITNRGNVAVVTINDTLLERDRRAELQDGDVLGIDEYRIEIVDAILDTRPVSRLSVMASPQTMMPEPQDGRPAAVPGEIWDTLMDRFSISDSISSSRARPAPAAAADAPQLDKPDETASQTLLRNGTKPPKRRLSIDPLPGERPQSATSGERLQGDLLDALLEGMGLSDVQPQPQFDRETLRQLGHMFSMFSQGSVALLASRSILKRGVKADMTMVLDDANNPFKLLPSGKTVLMQMFGTRMPGFMPPTTSVRDALLDLQAHQLGMIAGMRAVIAAMLASFDPAQLEEAAKREGVSSRLARKAALWDYFVRSYGNTAGEMDRDFHTLFGEAFLHAYDQEVNQYKDAQCDTDDDL